MKTEKSLSSERTTYPTGKEVYWYKESKVREAVLRLKKYINEGWSNPDKKSLRNKLDKIFGKELGGAE